VKTRFAPKVAFKKGDTVQVITGDDKGNTGKVIQVYPLKGTALVEGINLHKKAVKPSQSNAEGGLVSMEIPVPVSNLKKVTKNEKAAEAAE